MTTAADARAGQAGWLFTVPPRQQVTAQALAAAGLPAGPLALVRLDLVRVSPAGRWHLASASVPSAGCCPALCQTAWRGREPQADWARLLDAAGLCSWCAAGLVVPGLEGRYLMLARYLSEGRSNELWTVMTLPASCSWRQLRASVASHDESSS